MSIPQRWVGPLIVGFMVLGVALIVGLNLNLNTSQVTTAGSSSGSETSAPPSVAVGVPAGDRPAGFREYPIGSAEAQKMKVAAVWLPPVEMEGMTGPMSHDVIHLEADVRATEGNPNGFALDEFVPYLKIRYELTPADGKEATQRGDLLPMVARDGLHYGASISMPKAGSYKLTYFIDPPSAGGLGRHSDSVTGVAPWWAPFHLTFDWDCPGPASLKP